MAAARRQRGGVPSRRVPQSGAAPATRERPDGASEGPRRRRSRMRPPAAPAGRTKTTEVVAVEAGPSTGPAARADAAAQWTCRAPARTLQPSVEPALPSLWAGQRAVAAGQLSWDGTTAARVVFSPVPNLEKRLVEEQEAPPSLAADPAAPRGGEQRAAEAVAAAAAGFRRRSVVGVRRGRMLVEEARRRRHCRQVRHDSAGAVAVPSSAAAHCCSLVAAAAAVAVAAVAAHCCSLAAATRWPSWNRAWPMRAAPPRTWREQCCEQRSSL